MSGKGNQPNEVSTGADRISEDTASQVQNGSYENMYADAYKQGDLTAALGTTGDAQKGPGLTKTGDFVYASQEQLDKMDLKQFANYVNQHDQFTQQAVAAHPQKIAEITARYSAALGPEANQTRESVQQFYKNAGLV